MVTRIITGVVGIVAAAFIIQTGGVVFAGFALLLSLLTYFEYTRAFQNIGKDPMFILGCLSIVAVWLTGFFHVMEHLAAVITGIIFLMLIMPVLLRRIVHFLDAALSVAGVLYVSLPFLYMMLLRNLYPDKILATPFMEFSFGCAMIWTLFLCTWASDTFAYFVGSACGKHKLASYISPNKTMEGFLGSLVASTVVGTVLGYLFGLPLIEMALLGLLLAVVATLGDLVESVAKRETHIKDSGNIIPGHGGIWDRFDSCLLTAPVLYYFVLFFGLAAK